jgi:hypothetical protein
MFHSILSSLDSFVSALQTLLYVDVVQPLLFKTGMMDYDEDTYDALYWVIVGVLEVLAMYAILRPLEALRPAEKWENRRGVRVDVLYTCFFSSRSSRCSIPCKAGCACITCRVWISTICGRA